MFIKFFSTKITYLGTIGIKLEISNYINEVKSNTMKLEWYNVKKKSAIRWSAFKLDSDNLPELNKGYEMTGPHKNVIAAMIASTI